MAGLIAKLHRRSRAAPQTRTVVNADPPPEYSAAIDMPRDVQTISSNGLDMNAFQRPPSYEAATSGLFKFIIPGGCPTPPGTVTSPFATGNSHKKVEEGQRNEGFISEYEGQRNEGYDNEEEGHRNEGDVHEGHHNAVGVPEGSRGNSLLADRLLSQPRFVLRRRSSTSFL